MATRAFKFLVEGPSCSGCRVIISRHVTQKSAEKALRLVKPEFAHQYCVVGVN